MNQQPTVNVPLKGKLIIYQALKCRFLAEVVIAFTSDEVRANTKCAIEVIVCQM